MLLFCKHHLIIPKQYSDWLISIKVWRKIGWSSIPLKLVKDFFDHCHYQSFIKNFVKENFDSDNGPLEVITIKAASVFFASWTLRRHFICILTTCISVQIIHRVHLLYQNFTSKKHLKWTTDTMAMLTSWFKDIVPHLIMKYYTPLKYPAMISIHSFMGFIPPSPHPFKDQQY